MAKLTKAEAKMHAEAEQLLAKPDLSHSPPLSLSAPAPPPSLPRIRAAPPLPHARRARRRSPRSRGHRAPLATSPCRTTSPPSTTPPPPLRRSSEPLHRPPRARLHLRTPATPFFPGDDLLLLSHPRAFLAPHGELLYLLPLSVSSPALRSCSPTRARTPRRGARRRRVSGDQMVTAVGPLARPHRAAPA